MVLGGYELDDFGVAGCVWRLSGFRRGGFIWNGLEFLGSVSGVWALCFVEIELVFACSLLECPSKPRRGVYFQRKPHLRCYPTTTHLQSNLAPSTAF